MLDTDVQAFTDFPRSLMGVLNSVCKSKVNCTAEPIDVNRGYFAKPLQQCSDHTDHLLDQCSTFSHFGDIKNNNSTTNAFGDSLTHGYSLRNSQMSNKRLRIDSDEQNDFLTWDSPAKKKKSSFTVKRCETEAFLSLLENPVISEFLTVDTCKRISDKYLLAMVFAYFKRAQFRVKEYTPMNFFVALYLANDIEEDEEENKYEIFPWALGRSWRHRYSMFLNKRDQLWKRIKYRAVVSRKCCEEVMALEPNHEIWRRERPEHHAGALRTYMRDDEDDDFIRGPDSSPRYCSKCCNSMETDSASPASTCWYLSSCSDSSPELPSRKTVKVVSNSTKHETSGLKRITSHDDLIWVDEEE